VPVLVGQLISVLPHLNDLSRLLVLERSVPLTHEAVCPGKEETGRSFEDIRQIDKARIETDN
jgi:hypothetical protein